MEFLLLKKTPDRVYHPLPYQISGKKPRIIPNFLPGFHTSVLYMLMKEFLHHRDEIGEPTRLGEALTIVGEPFGKSISNEGLLNMALELGLDPSKTEEAKNKIAATGFTNRFASHLPGEEPDMESAVQRTVGIGAHLLKETVKAHGWDGTDVFIDTSAFLPTSINKEILAVAGFNTDNILSRSYRYACAGAVGAFIDCLSDPALKDARIVIAALEPLSLLIDRSHFLSPATLSIPSIFGDANTLMAFTPNHFSLNVKEILIKPDKGLIKLNTLYNFDEMPSKPHPEYYYFADNGESIFRYSESGAYLNIESPGVGASLTMDGMGTAKFFGDETTAVIADLLYHNGNPNLLNELNGKNIILHPASKPVVNRIAKLLWREYHYLDTPSLPFLMDAAGHSNGSSATTLNRWRYMIENDMIDTRLPMLWIAPGIGSAIAGAIGHIKP